MKLSISVEVVSVSDYKAVEATGLLVLVSDKSVATLRNSLSFDVEKLAQIFEELHLGTVVIGVVLDVALMSPQVFHHVLLLSQLCVEEFLVGFEFGTETLVRIAHVLGFARNTGGEGVVDLALNVVLMEL